MVAETPEEFVERWVQLSNEMQQTGETEAYLEVSRECVTCRQVAKTVQRIYARGGRIETQGWKIRDSSVDREDSSSVDVLAEVWFDKTLTYDANGEVARRYPQGTATYRFTLGQDGAGWKLVALTAVAK